MKFQKELPIKYETDVLVVGAGPAGVAAALSASRQGKSVLLVDSQGSFGGAATTAYVPCFAPFGDGVNVLASGVGYEIRKMVSREVPLDAYWTPLKIEELKRAYDILIKGSTVICSLFTTLCDVVSSEGRVEYAVFCAKSGMFAAKARVYIDCTGDGDLCAYAGADFELGDSDSNVMPATLCSIWSNIDYSKRRGSDDRCLDVGFFDVVDEGDIGHTTGVVHLDALAMLVIHVV